MGGGFKCVSGDNDEIIGNIVECFALNIVECFALNALR